MNQRNLDNLKEHLESSMISLRRQLLLLFVRELMVSLASQGYRLNDLLEALARYSQTRDDWAKVTELLGQAAEEVAAARKRLVDE